MSDLDLQWQYNDFIVRRATVQLLKKKTYKKKQYMQ